MIALVDCHRCGGAGELVVRGEEWSRCCDACGGEGYTEEDRNDMPPDDGAPLPEEAPADDDDVDAVVLFVAATVRRWRLAREAADSARASAWGAR